MRIEWSPLDEGHHEVMVSRRRNARIYDRYDVGMFQGRKDSRFADKAVPLYRGGHRAVAKRFQRNEPAACMTARQVHDPLAAPRDLAKDVVAVHDEARRERVFKSVLYPTDALSKRPRAFDK